MDIRNKQTLFRGLVVNLDQMEVLVGGKGWHPFQVVRHPGGVAVLPVHDDGTVTLIRQLRPSIGQFLLEIPAGRLDAGEAPEACGRRELAEETGLVPGRFDSLGAIYSTPGFCDERIHLFLARDLEQGESAPEAYEDIETVRMPFSQALDLAAVGDISDAKTVAALFRAARVIG